MSMNIYDSHCTRLRRSNQLNIRTTIIMIYHFSVSIELPKLIQYPSFPSAKFSNATPCFQRIRFAQNNSKILDQ